MSDRASNDEAQQEKPPIPELLVCPECGKSNPAGTRYCQICGASLADVEPGQVPDDEEEEEKGGFFSRLFGRGG